MVTHPSITWRFRVQPIRACSGCFLGGREQAASAVYADVVRNFDLMTSYIALSLFYFGTHAGGIGLENPVVEAAQVPDDRDFVLAAPTGWGVLPAKAPITTTTVGVIKHGDASAVRTGRLYLHDLL